MYRRRLAVYACPGVAAIALHGMMLSRPHEGPGSSECRWNDAACVAPAPSARMPAGTKPVNLVLQRFAANLELKIVEGSMLDRVFAELSIWAGWSRINCRRHDQRRGLLAKAKEEQRSSCGVPQP